MGWNNWTASGEGDATRDRLAAWCLALAEQAEPDQSSAAHMSPEWVARLDEELPNLRAAITWLLARGEATRALRLLVAAEDFWTQRHLSDAELHRWLEAALAAAPDAPARDRALAHWLLSIGNGALGHDEVALFHAQQLLAVAEELGDPASLGFAHFALAIAWEASWRYGPGGGRLCRGHPTLAGNGRPGRADRWWRRPNWPTNWSCRVTSRRACRCSRTP